MSDEFVDLLKKMKSEDNEVRKTAENTFHKTKESHPNETLQTLLQIARTHKDVDVRAFSIVVLRKVFQVNPEKTHIFLTLNDDVKNIIRVELLNGVEKESDEFVKKNLCDLVADVAIVIFSNGGSWDEMLQWSMKMGATDNKEAKYCTFRIYKEIAGYFPEIQIVKENFNGVVDILLSGLTFNHYEVKLEALIATETFIQYCKEQREQLQKLIEPMLNIVPYCLENDRESCEKAIQVFIGLAEIDPGYFSPKINIITKTMIELAGSQNLPPDVNRLAAEFLVTLAENRPKMVKTNKDFVRSCIEILLKMMLNTPDIPIDQWLVSEESDDIRNYAVAEEYLDRLSIALEGETIVPLIWNYIPQFITNESWVYRHTALKALAMIAEGCVDILLPGLKDIVTMLVTSSEDKDPRVRHAAAYAIGQLSTDFGPQFQNNYHEQILPKVIALLNDKAFPKIQTFASAAIVNFCEKFDAPLLEPYLNDLLNGLCKLITEGSKKNQEQAILAICIVAQCAEKKFIPFYETLMPSLVQLFNSATDKKYRELRGKAMLCISTICMSVGKDVIEKDSQNILKMLKDAQDKIVDNDDPQEDFFLDSWANIAKCLGPSFAPYLEVVVPGIIEKASNKVEFQVGNNDQELEGWQYFDIGQPQRVGIHTSALDEKAKACNLLCNYAMATKEAFFPYIEEVSKIMVPLLEFLFNDEIKITAYVTLPCLLKSAKFAIAKNNNLDKNILPALFGYIYPAVFENAVNEKDTDMLLVGLESLHQCIHAAGENCLNNSQIVDIFKQVNVWVEDIRTKREDLLTDDFEDPTVFVREELSKEGQLVAEIAEILTATVKHHNNFLSIFNEVGMVNYTLGLISNGQSDCERQLGICIFDDIVEYTKEASHALFPTFIPAILQYAKHPHTGIRQAVTYGLGVYCQFGGQAVVPFIQDILNVLVEIIQAPDSRNKTFAASTENAISSIGKIIQHHPNVLGDKAPELIKLWLSWLPIQIDLVEAKVVHRQLCILIESNHPGILGDNFSNLPAILNIFSDITSSKLVKKDTNEKIINIMKQMQSQNPEILSKAFATLPQNKQDRLARQLA